MGLRVRSDPAAQTQTRFITSRRALASGFCLMMLITQPGCGATDSKKNDQASQRVAEPPPQFKTPAPSKPDWASIKNSAERAVNDYYDLVESQDFAGAWKRLSSTIQSSFGGYESWVKGFDSTGKIEVRSLRAQATSSRRAVVHTKIRSVDTDACDEPVSQVFSGAWQLMKQRGRWIAQDVRMKRVAGKSPVTKVDDCQEPAIERLGSRTCLPGYMLPAVTIPKFEGSGIVIPARRIPARRIPRQCFDLNIDTRDLSILNDYSSIDRSYSRRLTRKYWDGLGGAENYPDLSAPGFGELNRAGFPKTQYVRPYFRSNGTYVGGYWRNSTSDGLPTCRVIRC